MFNAVHIVNTDIKTTVSRRLSNVTFTPEATTSITATANSPGYELLDDGVVFTVGDYNSLRIEFFGDSTDAVVLFRHVSEASGKEYPLKGVRVEDFSINTEGKNNQNWKFDILGLDKVKFIIKKTTGKVNVSGTFSL